MQEKSGEGPEGDIRITSSAESLNKSTKKKRIRVVPSVDMGDISKMAKLHNKKSPTSVEKQRALILSGPNEKEHLLQE